MAIDANAINGQSSAQDERAVLAGVHASEQLSDVAVSVILLTYNHSKFIAQAARSILTQNIEAVPGRVEILVGEDCSTDDTAAILQQLDREFPGRMTLSLRPQNLGLSKNLEDCWQRCRGRYIAILEGDDYWTDPNKLAKVTRYLDEHPEYAGCWHAYYVDSKLPNVPSGVRPEPFPTAPIGVVELLENNLLRSYSLICYRRGIVTKFPLAHAHLASGDWLLNLMHAAWGPFGFRSDMMATYRLHSGGMIATLDPGRLMTEAIEVLVNFDAELDRKYHHEVNAAYDRRRQDLSRQMRDLYKISARYHALGLHKIADWLGKLTRLFSKARSN